MHIVRPFFSFMTHKRRILPPYVILIALFALGFLTRQAYIAYKDVLASSATHIQSKLTHSNSLVAMQSVVFDSAVTQGNLVLVAVSTYSSRAGNIATVTDNKGNTYKKTVANPVDLSSKHQLSVWYAVNVIGGSSFTITAKPSDASSYLSIAAHEYTGVFASDPLDQIQIGTGTSANAVTNLILPLSQADELLFAAYLHEDVEDSTVKPGSGYTLRQSQVEGFYEPLVTEDKIVSAVGKYDSSVTWKKNVSWKSVIVTFKLGLVSPQTIEKPVLQPTPIVMDGITKTYQIQSSADDVNQDDNVVTANSATSWIGTGGSVSSSYTGLRFTNIAIPKGAIIKSAHLEVFSTTGQNATITFSTVAQLVGNGQPYSITNKPAQGPFTKANTTFSVQSDWLANNWYQLEEIRDIVQEIVNRPDWAIGNSINLALKGNGSPYARKFIQSWDGSATFAPKLTITYQ